MSNLADDLYPEVLLDLRDKLADLLAGHGIQDAAAVAFALCEYLRTECSGRVHCLPKGRKRKPAPEPLPGQEDLFAGDNHAPAPADLPPLVAEVRERGHALLLEHGVAPALAELTAGRIAELLKREWMGERVYVPQGQSYELARRDEYIHRAAMPATMDEIRRKTGLTDQRIYQILRREQKRRQRKLF